MLYPKRVGGHCSRLFPFERQEDVQVIMECIQSELPVKALETERIAKSGSVLDVSVSISPIKDETGRITGASTIARGITPRMRAEDQLKLQSAALEAAANAIMITDSHGAILWVNGAFTTMTGYSKKEVLGKNPCLLKSGKQAERFYAVLWSTIASGKVWQGELVNRRKNGTPYNEEKKITPTTRDAGNPADRYYIAIKQDVTERKRVEQTLRQAEEN